jgi:hypothetical protein
LFTLAFDTGFVNVNNLCLLNLSSNLFVFAATGARSALGRVPR